jgi:atlastin
MGEPSDPLKGFSWRSGCERDTTGILMWSDVFLHKNLKTNENVAIIVMDTQGLFDHDTTLDENSKIFAIGSMLSSIQVFNINSRISEDRLSHLEFAAHIANVAAKNESSRPFQKLLFLIRDWVDEEDFLHGFDGGQDYLDEVLTIKKTHEKELVSVRKFISEKFQESQCFLLPPPGDAILKKSYDGKWESMKPQFKLHLSELIESLLCPKNLLVKEIGQIKFTGEEFMEHATLILESFDSPDMPKARTLYQHIMEKKFINASRDQVKEYRDKVMELLEEEIKEKVMKKKLKILYKICQESLKAESEKFDYIFDTQQLLIEFENEIADHFNGNLENIQVRHYRRKRRELKKRCCGLCWCFNKLCLPAIDTSALIRNQL